MRKMCDGIRPDHGPPPEREMADGWSAVPDTDRLWPASTRPPSASGYAFHVHYNPMPPRSRWIWGVEGEWYSGDGYADSERAAQEAAEAALATALDSMTEQANREGRQNRA